MEERNMEIRLGNFFFSPCFLALIKKKRQQYRINPKEKFRNSEMNF